MNGNIYIFIFIIYIIYIIYILLGAACSPGSCLLFQLYQPCCHCRYHQQQPVAGLQTAADVVARQGWMSSSRPSCVTGPD
jgi:hypothetical protein